eukprot:s36_g61.t1
MISTSSWQSSSRKWRLKCIVGEFTENSSIPRGEAQALSEADQAQQWPKLQSPTAVVAPQPLGQERAEVWRRLTPIGKKRPPPNLWEVDLLGIREFLPRVVVFERVSSCLRARQADISSSEQNYTFRSWRDPERDLTKWSHVCIYILIIFVYNVAAGHFCNHLLPKRSGKQHKTTDFESQSGTCEDC